jgi:adenine deaminase
MKESKRPSTILLFSALLLSVGVSAQRQPNQASRLAAKTSVREVNQVERPAANQVIAIVGATLIDGRGGPAIPDAVVIIRGEQIAAVGKRASIKIPPEAEVFDAKGLTLLPGLIDAHFHIDGDDSLPALYLSHGITLSLINKSEPTRRT